jgi:hypothetical protein
VVTSEVVVVVIFSGSCVEVTHITRHKKTPKRRVAFTIVLSIFGPVCEKVFIVCDVLQIRIH